MNVYLLRKEKRQQVRLVQVVTPMVESIMSMDGSISAMLAAARGYTVTRRTEFLAQYDQANRDFDSTAYAAGHIGREDRDRRVIQKLREHHVLLRKLSDQQIQQTDRGEADAAVQTMLEAARLRRTASDVSGEFSKTEGLERSRDMAELNNLPSLILLLVIASVMVLLFGAYAITRTERGLEESLNRQVRRTEAMIAGMADGVMLVDSSGRTVFVNPAGIEILGNTVTEISLEKPAEYPGYQGEDGSPLDARETPAALALSTGKAVKDVTLVVPRGPRPVTISMSAVPLYEGTAIGGVIVSFRDITERRRLEGELQLQAERSQILADAGAFFASHIDPVWVTQAVAERLADVLGDWAAVILKAPGSNELQVAAMHHRDMTSLGLARSFVYQQPLTVGEGLFGQVISTGSSALLSNLESGVSKEAGSASHAGPIKLASLLILPLRTRGETIGALVIASNNDDRQMSDQKLPLAEMLAERAALAIENARLYIDQVEARRKVEDLSRLKDEFLSIASHELRTPVTSIKGYTQLARTLIQENDLATSVEYLDVAIDQIDRMSRLILELLDVSRIETGRLEIRREPIEWRSLIRQVVERNHAAEPDRKFLEHLPEKTQIVHGDRDRLEQVLGNLMENAIKYSSDGTEITVRVKDEGDRVVTSISDQGIGIPADELGQVFERFHRGRHVSSSNYGGLGLGLYIAKQIVERHGGVIWVESREGQGTTFSFRMPSQAAKEGSPSGSERETPV
ncbi:MAG TPA: ATP-binding protein [Thermoanaerobaculia bacterium]|nr:ATP-binding protein [Thermoanaerobaculia bacterium]